MSIRIERLKGPALAGGIRHLARLRMRVFREWPYLYDGDPAYEEDYLSDFTTGAGAIIVAAIDTDAIVGAATGAPLGEHTTDFIPLFEAHGFDPDTAFYCGESVLLAPYRGRGIGHAFFDHREAHARQQRSQTGASYRVSSFCGVVRDGADPRCPPDYRPLDGFWLKRGYRPVDGMIGHYAWREVGDHEETRKSMQFWVRDLRSL